MNFEIIFQKHKILDRLYTKTGLRFYKYLNPIFLLTRFLGACLEITHFVSPL